MEKGKHSLDLTEFLAEDAEVKWAEGVLKIPSDVPFSTMLRMAKFRDAKDMGEKEIIEMKDIVVEILKTKNKSEDVDKFISKISIRAYNKVAKFVFDFITASTENDAQVKKKTV